MVTTFQIGLKVNADDEDEIAVQVSNTTTARWEELSFDFSGHIGKTFASMVIIPDFATGARSYGSINYWDDISFNSKTPVDPTGKIDFETRGNTWTWRVFSNGSTQSPTDFSVSPNPLKAGINTSAAVAKFVAHPDAARWAGVYTSNISSIKFDAANCIIKVMVYKNVVSPFQIGFKFNEEDEETDVDVQVLNTSTSGWEELIFDFTEQIGKTYACMVIIPDFAEDTRSYGSVNYWDNISFSVVSGISSNKVQQLDFFPNPFNEVLNIKTDADIVSLTISNLAGQTIKRIYSNGSERSFDVRDLSSGTYIAALKTKDGKTFTQKIVKL